MKGDSNEFILYCCTAVLLVVYIFASQKARGDNEIFVDQTGYNLQFGVEQIGNNNNATVNVDGSGQQLLIIQHNETTTDNSVSVDVVGDNNLMRVCQGCGWAVPASETDHTTVHDNFEGGGHTVQIDVTGNGNRVSGSQTNQGSTAGHSFDLTISADDNDVEFKQQSDGAKTVDLTIYNNQNDVFVRQHGSGANHTATVELDGTYGTDLDLKQLGVTTQTYNLIQNCLNPAGCSVSVTQQ